MGNIIKVNAIPSKMDTKEIASIADKNHGHVLRDTRVMLLTLFGGAHVDSVIPANKASQRGQFIRDNVEALFKGAFEDDPVLDHEQNQCFTLHYESRGYLSSVELNRNLTLTLASGYDIHLRNRIISRLEELEQAAALPKPAPSKPARASMRYREAAAITGAQLKICKLLGVDDGMAKVIAAKEVKAVTGLDYTNLLTTTAATDNPRTTPKELAVLIGAGATSEQVNNALEQLSFQTKERWTNGKGQPRSKWVVTELGKEYGALVPYQAVEHQHSGYRPAWYASVVELIRPLVEVAMAQRTAPKPKRDKKPAGVPLQPASQPQAALA
ncbi:DNA-binding domain protein [Delftia acidovorans]|uniref:hypothetical protein n=1 Tax=Delftia acidovorans TaxID=80866 RepID=UPI0005055507|nr:hypothetical protein [Delftia acidovorans]KFJ09152.1 DNA-binding domain protein [Delftia acidovorans]QQB52736.1 hypothetical protein I6H54_10935 [Delftia acidovorans]